MYWHTQKTHIETWCCKVGQCYHLGSYSGWCVPWYRQMHLPITKTAYHTETDVLYHTTASWVRGCLSSDQSVPFDWSGFLSAHLLKLFSLVVHSVFYSCSGPASFFGILRLPWITSDSAEHTSELIHSRARLMCSWNLRNLEYRPKFQRKGPLKYCILCHM